MLPQLAASLLCVAPATFAQPFAKGDLVAAWRTVNGADDLQGRYLACLLVPRCAWQDGLRPMLLDAERGFAKRPPMAIIPPQKPALAGKPAWVNVATAMLREKPDAASTLKGRLPIGTRVEVQKLEGAFARVKGGHVHKDLLSAQPPTVKALLAAADAERPRGLDGEVTMLWRAFNLDPKRRDVLERLVVSALKAERAPVVGDALDFALSHGTWPDGDLYRAALARNADAIAPQLPDPDFFRRYYAVAGDGVIFQLTDGLLGNDSEGLTPSECDWEILRGARTAAEPCRVLETMGAVEPEAKPAAPREQAAPSDGRPVVAFYDYDTNAGIVVKRWNGKVWEPVGSPRGKGRQAARPRLAMQGNGEPALLYVVDNQSLYFERWTGKAWEGVAGSASGGGLSELAAGRSKRTYQTALAIDGSDQPVVAVLIFDDPCTYVLRLEGSGWRKLGCVKEAWEPSLVAIDAEPFLFFGRGEFGNDRADVIWVARWKGTTWVEERFAGSDHSSAPRAGFGPDGAPVVIWPLCDRAAAKGARFNGKKWETFGGGSSSCSGGGQIPMTVDSKGRPVVVMLGPGPGGPFPVRVQRWDDGQWQQLGKVDGRADEAAIVRDQDRLVLTWSEVSRLRVVSWDGAEWTALADPAGRGRWGNPALIIGR